MSLFKHHGRERGPWDGAPNWAREIGEFLAIAVCQNEAILAKLEDRPCKLSPEDQAIMTEIFDTATASVAKAGDGRCGAPRDQTDDRLDSEPRRRS